MIDEDNGCIKKSKLIITVKTLSTYNDRSWVAAKQTNKQTYIFKDTEIHKHSEGRKIHTYTSTQKQTYCGHTHTES